MGSSLERIIHEHRRYSPTHASTGVRLSMQMSCRSWIGYNVLDWFMRDMTTKELIIMADPNRPRHYE
ncbi:MAG: hypothetical protein E7D39_06280, partial [Bifidobacterium longum]|nr:hypothetical protein [Bifidobacterium longum]